MRASEFDPHPTPLELEQFARGVIPARVSEAIEAHLLVCSECERRLESTESGDGLTRLLRRVARPSDG